MQRQLELVNEAMTKKTGSLMTRTKTINKLRYDKISYFPGAKVIFGR